MVIKKKILITGCNGFVGHELCKHLKKKYDIYGVDLHKSKQCGIKHFSVVDLRDNKRVKDFCGDFKKGQSLNSLINLSARMMSTDRIEDISILHDNIRIAENVALLADSLRPAKVINFSSMAVYPMKSGIYKEASQIRPSLNSDCIYGLSKFCVENILSFMLRDTGVKVSNLRIAQVYGEGMRNDRIIPVMLDELEKKNMITVFGNGERVSNFIHVDRLVRIVEKFLEKDLEGIFNVGDEQLSYFELAGRLIREKGNKDSRILKKAAGSKERVYLDTTKVKEIFA